MAKTAPQTFRLNQSLFNQRGTYLILSAIVILVIIGFAALGIEIGRWYAIQGELGKAADGAAFAGAKNVDNPNVDLETLAKDVAEANFSPGLLGTDNNPIFNVTENQGRVTVDGTTNSLNPLAPGFNKKYRTTKIGTEGAAKLRRAEIALILDVSGSMYGAIGDLRDGAKLFVENFEDQEDRTKMALLAFASGIEKLYDMDYGYTNQMTTQINGLKASGSTNAEDALGQADALPWENQTGLSQNERTQQAVIFFSDGNPNTFRSRFKRDNSWHEAAGNGYSKKLFAYDKQFQVYTPDFDPKVTGDGLPAGQSACGTTPLTVKWEIFEDPDYGLASGIYPPLEQVDPDSCDGVITDKDLHAYANAIARQMAIDHAASLKARGIAIYTIGLGSVDRIYLAKISSGSKYQFYTSDPKELDSIFQKIANMLKLVLVK